MTKEGRATEGKELRHDVRVVVGARFFLLLSLI